MRSRRWAREVALQALYQFDVLEDWSESNFKLFLDHFYPEYAVLTEESDNSVKFFHNIVLTALQSKEQIDSLIRKASLNWSLEEMVCLDRSILRMSICQLLKFDDIPPKVVIDEGLEITKRFSSYDATTFINGVLDKVLKLIVQIPLADPLLIKQAQNS